MTGVTDETLPADPLSGEGAERLLKQAFEVWITPEIERRQTEGQLPKPFELSMAQRLQWPDGRIEVRLNEEVRGVGFVRATREFEKDDDVLLSDLENLEGFDVLEEELNAGHWTVIWTGKRWFIGFNFLANRARCLDLLMKAERFSISAREAREAGHPEVAVDTLFSACELIAKAELVASHVLDITARTHAAVANQINNWRRMGNVESAFVDLFNRLRQLRPRYRYDAVVSEDEPVTLDDLALVEAMVDAGRNRVAPINKESLDI